MTISLSSHGWAAALALALSLSASDADAQQRTRFAGGRSSIDTTVDFSRGGTVTLTAGPGDIVVTPSSNDRVRVFASSDNDNIRMDVGSNRLSVELAGSFRSRGDTRFEVSVPRGVRVIARTQSGDVSIRGTQGAVEVHTQSGDVALEDVADRLDINTLSGDIRVRSAAGDIDIVSIGGDVELMEVKGTMTVQTTSGDIVIRRATSKLVRAKTTSGDVSYDGTIDAAGRYDLSSHSGDVGVAIPSDASAQLTISTWSGEINTDFPITLKPGEHGIGSSNSKRFTFAIGGGGARITAETFSGDIDVKRTTSR